MISVKEIKIEDGERGGKGRRNDYSIIRLKIYNKKEITKHLSWCFREKLLIQFWLQVNYYRRMSDIMWTKNKIIKMSIN